jgi:hypothetical protein
LEDFGFNDCRKFSDDETKRQTITLNYLSFSEFGSLHITLKNSTRNGMVECKKEAKDSYSIVKESVIENFLLDYDIINVGQGNESGFFKDYISFNNRYIKYFSLAIADTISFSTKKEILKKYRKKCKLL